MGLWKGAVVRMEEVVMIGGGLVVVEKCALREKFVWIEYIGLWGVFLVLPEKSRRKTFPAVAAGGRRWGSLAGEMPWLDNGIWKELKPVEHTCKPSNYKTGCSEWPTCSWRKDGYCNGGNFPDAYHIRNSLHYQDLECYEALEDSELKDEALRNKAIMEGLIKEYVAVKEDEYDDLTITSEEACRAYQEIFRMMDEGWIVTRTEYQDRNTGPHERISTNIGGEFTNLEILKCWSLETSRRLFNTILLINFKH
ncbi:hypothetical protein Tco_1329313 [Tanacetum coccineum]